MTRTVGRCPCGSPVCLDWRVIPEASVRGAGFRSERRARLVARYLDLLDSCDDNLDLLALQIAERARRRDDDTQEDRRESLRVTHAQIAILDLMDPDRQT